MGGSNTFGEGVRFGRRAGTGLGLVVLVLGLQGCVPLAIPGSERKTFTHRFVAAEVAHPSVPAGTVLISRLNEPSNQPDQWLVVLPQGWQLDERYDVQEEQGSRATLCYSHPMDALTLPKSPRVQDGWTFIGDLFAQSLPELCHGQVWYSPRTERFDVRMRHARIAPDQVLTVLDLKPSGPGIQCDVTTTRYTLDTVVLPLPMSARTHEVGQKQVFKCVRL